MISFLACFTLLAGTWRPGLSEQEEETDFVSASARIEPPRLAKGQEGAVVLRLALKPDIYLSHQPSFTIELISSDVLVFPKNFFTASDLGINVVAEEGREYLDVTDPIEISFTVNSEAERGYYTFNGKIKYFACSKSEGWMLKKTADFAADFIVRN